MAKKNKKQSRYTPSSYQTRAEVPGAVMTSTFSKSTEPAFNPDYSQTKKDLKRIGILAGAFFSILIVLSFFLR